jgi:hypothetical protein
VFETIWEGVGHLKDITSVITPIVLAVVGFRINSTIQNQNKIAERNSALVKQWADGFGDLYNNIDRTATKVLILYITVAHAEHFARGKPEESINNLNKEIPGMSLLFEEYKMNIEKYIDLAPKSGIALSKSFNDLLTVCRKWFQENGGNREQLRAIQIYFNECARTTHRELLRLDD